MNNELKAMIAGQIVAEQIRQGSNHPSAPLIAKAVDIAEAIEAELEARDAARAKAAADAKAADAAAAQKPA